MMLGPGAKIPAAVIAYWIQITGASALAIKDLSSPSYDVGRESSAVHDDLDGVEAIRSLIRAHPSREMDNYVLDASKATPSIRTALILPPIIYGKGEGPGNQRSIQIPSLSRVTLEKGHVVRAGKGLNRWGSIHVADIARVFTGLAVEASKDRQDEALWNDNGIYLTSAGEMVCHAPGWNCLVFANVICLELQSFAEISDRVSRAAREKGLIQSAEVEELSKAESDKVLPGGSVFFGSNARGNARRATALFGWKPTEESLEAEIPRAVAEEASRRG